MTENRGKANYRVRYIKVMENLNKVNNMQPKVRYMYSLIDTVIFQDFETALDGVMEDFKDAQNDNNKKEEGA